MRESSNPRFGLTVFYRFRNIHCSAIFFFLWHLLITSCSGSINWVYPGAENTGLTFNYIDIVYFTWTSNFTSLWMDLWCAPNPTSPQSQNYGKTYQTLRFTIYHTLTEDPRRETIAELRLNIQSITAKYQRMARILSHSHTTSTIMMASVTCSSRMFREPILPTLQPSK